MNLETKVASFLRSLPKRDHSDISSEQIDLDEIEQLYTLYRELCRQEHILLLEVEKVHQKKTEINHLLHSKKKGLTDQLHLLKKGHKSFSIEEECKLLYFKAFFDINKSFSEQFLLDRETKEWVNISNSNIKRLTEPLPNSIYITLQKPSLKASISGPEYSGSQFITKQSGDRVSSAYAKSITTFPYSALTGAHEISPSDSFNIKLYKDRITFAFSKGTEWGEKHTAASILANNAFISFLESHLSSIYDVTSCVITLIQSLYKAHMTIKSESNGTQCIFFGGYLGRTPSIREMGGVGSSIGSNSNLSNSPSQSTNITSSSSTSIIQSLNSPSPRPNSSTHGTFSNSISGTNSLSPIPTIQSGSNSIPLTSSGDVNKFLSPSSGGGGSGVGGGSSNQSPTSSNRDQTIKLYGMTYIHVGNIMAFHFSYEANTWKHITSRNAARDSDKDLTGGIGSLNLDGEADLKGLDVGHIFLTINDLLLFCSDGVYDNLDPEYLGVSPQECGLKQSWIDAKILCPEECSRAKIRFMTNRLREITSITRNPKAIVEEIMTHCEQTTASSRAFLLSNKGKRLPSSYSDYPGKLGYCTCICISPTSRAEQTFSVKKSNSKLPKLMTVGNMSLQISKVKWSKLCHFLGDNENGNRINELLNRLPSVGLNRSVNSIKMAVLQGPVSPYAPNDEFTTDIGPGSNLDFRNTVMKYMYGRSVSSYPSIPGLPNRDGDPMCDYFTCKMFEHYMLFTLTDGCNWGTQVRKASVIANNTFINHMKASIKKDNDLRELGISMLIGLRKAHRAIWKDAADPFSTGCTTLIGGAVVRTNSEHNESPWGVLMCSVGDCKAFVYSTTQKRFIDISEGARCLVKEAKDSGGRIGITTQELGADLRNLDLIWKPLVPGDYLFVCSDGVHDNLDPELLNKPPQDCGLTNWTCEQDSELININSQKSKFMANLLTEFFREVSQNSDSIPKDFVEYVIQHCLSTTEPSREFLTSVLGKKRLPSDLSKYPGKMDHTTGLCLQVMDFEQIRRLSYLFRLNLHLETYSETSIEPSSLKDMLNILTAKPDIRFWEDMLCACDGTISNEELCDSLWEFFNYQPENAPEDALYQHQSGVIMLLQRWIRLKPEDFIGVVGDKTLQHLEKNGLVTHPINSELLEIRSKYVRLLPIQSFRKIGDHPITLLQINPEKLAEQLTLMESAMMKLISPSEFLQQNWLSTDQADVKAPNIISLLAWYSKMSGSFTSCILRETVPELQSKAISHLIEVASKCEELKNFNGLMEILSSLTHSSVKNLTKPWMMVTKGNRDKLCELLNLMSPKDNFRNYRLQLQDCSQPFIPFLSPFLADFLFLHEYKPDLINGLINWPKLVILGRRISHLLRFQHKTYNTLFTDRDVQSYIHFSETLTQNDLLRFAFSYQENERTEKYKKKLYNLEKHFKHFTHISLTGQVKMNTSLQKLSQQDWSVFLTSASLIKLENEDILLEEDVKSENFFRIAKGSIHVLNSKGDTIIVLGVDDIYGEIFLLNQRNVSPYKAISVGCSEVHCIPVSTALSILDSDPHLSHRFFLTIGQRFSSTLRRVYYHDKNVDYGAISSNSPLSSSSQSLVIEPNFDPSMIPSIPNTSQSNPNVLVSRSPERNSTIPVGLVSRLTSDEGLNFNAKFGKSESVIKEMNCMILKGNMANYSSGKVFVTQNYLAYYFKTFGLETKVCLPITNIVEMHIKSETRLKLTFPKKKNVSIKFKEASQANELYQTIGKISKSKKNSYDSSSTPPSPFRESELHISQPMASESLTAEDWETILNGSRTLLLNKGMEIIIEGSTEQRIYQISRGSCNAVKAGKIIGTLIRTGEVFGEASFIDGFPATCTVVAAENDTELCVIEGWYVHILIQLKPSLAGRFYQYLASVVANRLIHLTA